VLIATVAWLVWDGITLAVKVHQGVQNMAVPLDLVLVAVASVVGAGVGTQISPLVMPGRRSLGKRLISAVVSLVLAVIAAFVVGAGVAHLMHPGMHSDLGGFMAAVTAVAVAGPTGLVFGFTGGVFKKQIPTNSDSRPSTPSEGCTQDALVGEHPARNMKQSIGVASPVLIATAAWLVLYAIGVAERLYEGEQIRGMPFEAPMVVVGCLVGVGVGRLVSRGVMWHRRSLGWRILSAGVSLVLAWFLAGIADCVLRMVVRKPGPPRLFDRVESVEHASINKNHDLLICWDGYLTNSPQRSRYTIVAPLSRIQSRPAGGPVNNPDGPWARGSLWIERGWIVEGWNGNGEPPVTNERVPIVTVVPQWHPGGFGRDDYKLVAGAERALFQVKDPDIILGGSRAQLPDFVYIDEALPEPFTAIRIEPADAPVPMNAEGGLAAVEMGLWIAAPTGLVFGFAGRALKKQIAAKSESQPSTPSEDRTQDSLAREHPATVAGEPEARN
jgi:hypothetical protein